MTDRPEISCEQAIDWVEDAARDRLDRDRSRQLDAHLDGCAGCRAVLEEGHLASAGEGRGLAWHPPR